MSTNDQPYSDEEQQYLDRYQKALHAMQSGVATKMNYDDGETSPKHLRVGVNAAMSDLGALVAMLIEKGVITQSEYLQRIAEYMERERDSYQRQLQEHFGGNITLG